MSSKVETQDLFACHAMRASARAREGAEYLDENCPGWVHRLEKPVKMASTHECILAQLYGRYRTGLVELGLDDTRSHLLGFRGCRHELQNSMRAFAAYYKALSEAWQHEVQMRLAVHVGKENAELCAAN